MSVSNLLIWHCDGIGIHVSLKKKILWVRVPSMLPIYVAIVQNKIEQ